MTPDNSKRSSWRGQAVCTLSLAYYFFTLTRVIFARPDRTSEISGYGRGCRFATGSSGLSGFSKKPLSPPGLYCDLSPNGLDDPNKVVLYLV